MCFKKTFDLISQNNLNYYTNYFKNFFFNFDLINVNIKNKNKFNE